MQSPRCKHKSKIWKIVHYISHPADGLKESLQGKFITFEGIDGCGKTTQAKLLCDRLRSKGLTVELTREPGGTEIGSAIRQVLLDVRHLGMTPQCELLLFLGDRIQHLVEFIQPALARGAVVICDRYHDATIAYQQYGRELDLSALKPFIVEFIRPLPNLTFWIDITVEQSLRRTLPRHGKLVEGIRKPSEEFTDSSGSRSPQQNSSLSLQLAMPLEDSAASQSRLDLEYREFHERVREGYRAISSQEPQRVIYVDGTPPTEAVQEDIWDVLNATFAL
jgi:dTMP kinase